MSHHKNKNSHNKWDTLEIWEGASKNTQNKEFISPVSQINQKFLEIMSLSEEKVKDLEEEKEESEQKMLYQKYQNAFKIFSLFLKIEEKSIQNNIDQIWWVKKIKKSLTVKWKFEKECKEHFRLLKQFLVEWKLTKFLEQYERVNDLRKRIDTYLSRKQKQPNSLNETTEIVLETHENNHNITPVEANVQENLDRNIHYEFKEDPIYSFLYSAYDIIENNQESFEKTKTIDVKTLKNTLEKIKEKVVKFSEAEKNLEENFLEISQKIENLLTKHKEYEQAEEKIKKIKNPWKKTESTEENETPTPIQQKYEIPEEYINFFNEVLSQNGFHHSLSNTKNSKNHNSQGDGSFATKIAHPLFVAIRNIIQNGQINPQETSWKEIMNILQKNTEFQDAWIQSFMKILWKHEEKKNFFEIFATDFYNAVDEFSTTNFYKQGTQKKNLKTILEKIKEIWQKYTSTNSHEVEKDTKEKIANLLG